MSKTRWPPGPPGFPVLGNLVAFSRDPTGFLLALARDYGDVAHFRLGKKHAVQINHPDLIHDVLITHHRRFCKTRGLDRAGLVIGDGLLRSEGEFHRRQRRLIQPAFQQARIAAYAPVVTSHAARTAERWRAGETVDIFAEMLHLTLTIAGETLFNADLDAGIGRIGKDLTIVFEYFNRLMLPFAGLLARLPLGSRRSFESARRRLDDMVYGMIRDRRASGDSGDILSTLLFARDDEGDHGGMTDRQLRDEAMTIFLAGHETTATAVSWVWYVLAQHPNVEGTLHDELGSVLGGRLPTFSDLDRLTYTRMVISEAMRLYPPVWTLTRRATEDYVVGDYLVPSGTTIGMSQYVMHRDPRYYVDPERFDPLRWEPAQVAARPKHCYFPFGSGPRLCIGEKFGWLESSLIIATLAQFWRPRALPGYQARFQPLIALRPRGGIPMRLERTSERQCRFAQQVASADEA